METIEIRKENVQKAFHEAGSNPALQSMLKTIFGDAVEPEQTPKDIRERVRSYEDACTVLGIPQMVEFDNYEPDEIAYIKLKTITQALNEGWKPKFTEDEWRYYPWFYLYTQDELDEMEDEEKEERRMRGVDDFQTEYAGFGSALTDYAPSRTDATFGSRLCFSTRDLAIYCGKQFIDLWMEYTLIRK